MLKDYRHRHNGWLQNTINAFFKAISLKKEDSCNYNILTPHLYYDEWIYNILPKSLLQCTLNFFYVNIVFREVQLYLSAKVLKPRVKHKYYQFPSC